MFQPVPYCYWLVYWWTDYWCHYWIHFMWYDLRKHPNPSNTLLYGLRMLRQPMFIITFMLGCQNWTLVGLHYVKNPMSDPVVSAHIVPILISPSPVYLMSLTFAVWMLGFLLICLMMFQGDTFTCDPVSILTTTLFMSNVLKHSL